MSEIILSAKSLLSEWVASWAKQAFSNSFLYKCFKLLISLNFWILSWCLVNSSQALSVNPGCFKCSSGISLSPIKKICEWFYSF